MAAALVHLLCLLTFAVVDVPLVYVVVLRAQQHGTRVSGLYSEVSVSHPPHTYSEVSVSHPPHTSGSSPCP
jgi:hypothetical protein